MEEQNLTVGLNEDLKKIVDTLAVGGYEVCGIEPEGFINSRLERPAYKVIVTKAVPKNGRANSP
jgi:hypothetical protein